MSYVNRKNWKNNSSGMGYHKKTNVFLKILINLLVVFIIFETLTTFFFTTHKVKSLSMEPTILSGSIVASSPLIYGSEISVIKKRLPKIKNPDRGDVVINSPAYLSNKDWYIKAIDTVIKFVTLQEKSFGNSFDKKAGSFTIKRVIGIPGDTIKISESTAFIKPAGGAYFLSEQEIIDIDYNTISITVPKTMANTMPLTGNMDEIILGEDEYFLLGDNRSFSNDSYYWGVAKEDTIKAKVLFEYMPDFHIIK